MTMTTPGVNILRRDFTMSPIVPPRSGFDAGEAGGGGGSSAPPRSMGSMMGGGAAGDIGAVVAAPETLGGSLLAIAPATAAVNGIGWGAVQNVPICAGSPTLRRVMSGLVS